MRRRCAELKVGERLFWHAEAIDVRTAIKNATCIDHARQVRVGTCGQCGHLFELPPRRQQLYCGQTLSEQGHQGALVPKAGGETKWLSVEEVGKAVSTGRKTAAGEARFHLATRPKESQSGKSYTAKTRRKWIHEFSPIQVKSNEAAGRFTRSKQTVADFLNSLARG